MTCRMISFSIITASTFLLAACQGGGRANPADFLICENEGGRPFEMVETSGRAVVMCHFSDGRQIEVSQL